ncbi:molybdopterin molybdotransferase [Candidatus Methanophagaceae archaeon]|nr:molybdopterin molybdotransferase [Methanophagales archaeon]
MGKEFLEITEKEEVSRIIAELSAKLADKMAAATEKVRVNSGDALGRIASTDFFSPLDIPPFDRATMDGYAVLASDTFYAAEDNPASLTVKGYILAGEVPSQKIEKGVCIGISTGAPIPKGADAVVKIENTDEDDTTAAVRTVKIYKPVAPGENIMLAGSDIKQGEQIVKSGAVLTPRETGVLAACGLNEVLVRKKPVVAVISTGNEIVTPGDELARGKIYDVNAQTLGDSVRDNGCTPLFLGITRDNIKEMAGKLRESRNEGADVIILSGGTSAGAGDVLPIAIEEQGEILVHGVDIKPGKPFILGLCREKAVPVFGLPGNPTSALITFNLFVAPLLRTISGEYPRNEAEMEKAERTKAKAAIRIFSEPGRNEYVLVNLVMEGEKHVVYPILTGSGAITTLSKADGYVFMTKGKEIVEEGEEVEVALLTKPFSFGKRKAFTEKKKNSV